MKLVTPALLLVVSVSMARTDPSGFKANASMGTSEAFSVAANVTPRGLPVINDDFEKARAEANKRKLPLFVEVWAPW